MKTKSLLCVIIVIVIVNLETEFPNQPFHIMTGNHLQNIPIYFQNLNYMKIQIYSIYTIISNIHYWSAKCYDTWDTKICLNQNSLKWFIWCRYIFYHNYIYVYVLILFWIFLSTKINTINAKKQPIPQTMNTIHETESLISDCHIKSILIANCSKTSTSQLSSHSQLLWTISRIVKPACWNRRRIKERDWNMKIHMSLFFIITSWSTHFLLVTYPA